MSYSNSIPGQRTGISVTPRDVLMNYDVVRFGRGTIDADKAYDGANTNHEDELRPGTILGQITASKLWVPCKRTAANGAGATVTALVVDDARAFKAGDSIKIAALSAQDIVSVNYATNTITLTSAVTWADGAAVVAVDGSETARAILNEFVKLKDEDGVARNKMFGQAVICGLVYPSMLLGDAAAIRADTGNKLSHIQFGDDAGQV